MEFKVSTGFKIFYCCVAAVMAIFSVVLFSMPANSKVVMLIPVVILLSAICMVISQFKRGVIISDESITRTNLFGSIEIPVAIIKGVRFDNKLIVIEYTGDKPGKISISNYSDFTGSEKMSAWLAKNFIDLNHADTEANLNEILNDSSLGASKQDRQAVLDRIKQIAIAYNVFAVFPVIMGIMSGNKIVIALLLVYPLLGVWVILQGKTLIRFLPEKNSPRYSVFFGVMAGCVLLIIRSMTDFELVQMKNFWLPFLIVSSVLAVLFYLADVSQKAVHVKGTQLLFLIVGALYSLGTTREVNCVYDTSAEQLFKVQVIDHRIHRGKGTSYYITLDQWGPFSAGHEVSVSNNKYYSTPLNSMVNVHYKKGLLNIPWFTLSD